MGERSLSFGLQDLTSWEQQKAVMPGAKRPQQGKIAGLLSF